MSDIHAPDDDCVVIDGDDDVTGVTADDVSEFVAQSKGFGKVIQCRTSDGRVIEFLPYLAGSVGSVIWVKACNDCSHIADEPAVRNMVGSCQPDVRLVEELESMQFSPEPAATSEVGP